MKKAKVYMHNELAGFLTETTEGYTFLYDSGYLASPAPESVSGLIPEGWLLDIAEKNWKLNARDRMGLLLACCRDCVGAVSIVEDNS